MSCKPMCPAGPSGPVGPSTRGRKSTDGLSSKNIKVTYKPYVQPVYKDHDYKNMSLKRPMSPHLTIYEPTMTAMTSILERITGIILTFYGLMLSFGTLFLANGVETYVTMIQSLDLSRPTIFATKLLLGLPFTFHYFCGIRFCAWNAGHLLSKAAIVDSANKCFIATAVTTVLFALL